MTQARKMLEFFEENKEHIVSAKSIAIVLLDDANTMLKDQESNDTFRSFCKKNRKYGAIRVLIPEKYCEQKRKFFSNDTLNRAAFKNIPGILYDNLMSKIKKQGYDKYFIMFGDESWDEAIEHYQNKTIEYEILNNFIKAWIYNEIKNTTTKPWKGVNYEYWEYDKQRYDCGSKWQTIRKNHLNRHSLRDHLDYPYFFEIKKYSDNQCLKKQ